MRPPEPGVFGREHVSLLTAAEASALDRRAQAGGIPERALMENAGRAAALVLQRLHPTGRIVAVVGSGNNGGDALVALRSLRSWGRDAAYLPVGSSDPDPRLLTQFDVPRIDAAHARAAFAGAAVLVDGILGTGAKGEPREPAASAIRAMNESGRPVIALDIPSGVDPTTGAVPGLAVTATTTIMFGWPKTGALFQPGRARCGRLVAVEIGFPPLGWRGPDGGGEQAGAGAAGAEAGGAEAGGAEAGGAEAGAALITPAWAKARLPFRWQGAHKNSVGRVLVVAGRKGMGGAAAIAGHSAMRAGAGYVRIASVEENRTIVQTLVPEALFVDRSDHGALREAVAQSDAVLIGPALGTDAEGAAILDLVLEATAADSGAAAGCVLDADALSILAGREDGLTGLGHRALLTPHPGEMSRLIGRPVPEIQADPVGHARRLAEDTRVTVLLKGAPSVVARPGYPVLVSSVGSSDLATAAMGDQLGGEAAAFLAAGAAPDVAGALALFYGGRASELAARGRSLTPHDIADALHRAFEDPGPDRSPLDLPFVLFDQPPRW